MYIAGALIMAVCSCQFAIALNGTAEEVVPYPETVVTEVEFVHNTGGTKQLVQQLASQISTLQMKTDRLTRQVSSLRSNNIALSVAMQAMNAAGRKEVQDVRNELDEAMSETSSTLEEHSHRIYWLESQIEDLNETEEAVIIHPPTTATTTATTTPALPRDCKCQYRYGNYCYFIYQWYITYTQAKKTCQRENATLGYPQDEQSYLSIIQLYKRKFPVGMNGWHGLWLGLTLPYSGGPKLLDGEDAPYIDWRREEPSRGYSETAIMIMAGSSNEGMDDISPARSLSGALCMYEIQAYRNFSK